MRLIVVLLLFSGEWYWGSEVTPTQPGFDLDLYETLVISQTISQSIGVALTAELRHVSSKISRFRQQHAAVIALMYRRMFQYLSAQLTLCGVKFFWLAGD